MIEELESKLAKDTNGLLTYEYIANHINSIDDMMPDLVENMIRVDKTGQFVVSTARYLHAIDPNSFLKASTRLSRRRLKKTEIGHILPIWWLRFGERIIRSGQQN